MPKIINVAAIDIGSNGARIMIKSISENLKVKKLQFLRIPLRLGEDVFNVGLITPQREKLLERTLKIFKQLMKIYGVQEYRAYATSAMREAGNGIKIIRSLNSELGLDVRIITGEEEATIICNNNALSDYEPNLFVDVGGGSTEVSLFVDAKPVKCQSFNVGTLRMLSHDFNPKSMKKLADEVAQIATQYPGVKITGSGGNINKLYKLANKQTPGLNNFLPVSQLEEILHNMESLSVEDRMEKYDLRQDRADVIVPAATVFISIAKAANITHIYVPTLGLVDAMINKIGVEQFG